MTKTKKEIMAEINAIFDELKLMDQELEKEIN